MSMLRDGRNFFERFVDSWRFPRSISVLLPESGLSLEALNEALSEREEAILEDLAETDGLHALRVFVAPPTEGYGPRLMLNSISDEDYLDHLQSIGEALAPHLADLLPDDLDTDRMAEVLQEHRLHGNTLFLASEGVSLEQIREEARLREVLREWLDEMRESGELEALSPEQARQAAREYVLGLDDTTCARGPAPKPTGTWRRHADFVVTFTLFPLIGVLGKDILLAVKRIRNPIKRALWMAAMTGWWTWAAAFTGAALVFVRTRELIEPDTVPLPAPPEKLDRLEAIEDSRHKNELTIWFPVKPDLIGKLLMWLVLFGAERGTRHLWTDGALAGARNIHYARLVLANQGRRMVFMSDYEGSFDAYMDHFVGVGGNTRAVIPISSRVEGCPKTRWLYLAENEVEFRRRWREMARSYQVQAAVRYVAYESLSANDIINHRVIRDRLFADYVSPADLADWMSRI